MMQEFDYIDVEEANRCFDVIDGRLIRKSDNPRWDGLDCTNRRTVRMGLKRFKSNRITFAILNDRNPAGYVVTNDNGDLIEITDTRVFMVYVYAKSPKIDLNGRWKKPYCARYTPNTEPTQGDDRIMKCFETKDAALSWFYACMNDDWHDTFAELNLLSAITL